MYCEILLGIGVVSRSIQLKKKQSTTEVTKFGSGLVYVFQGAPRQACILHLLLLKKTTTIAFFFPNTAVDSYSKVFSNLFYSSFPGSTPLLPSICVSSLDKSSHSAAGVTGHRCSTTVPSGFSLLSHHAMEGQR